MIQRPSGLGRECLLHQQGLCFVGNRLQVRRAGQCRCGQTGRRAKRAVPGQRTGARASASGVATAAKVSAEEGAVPGASEQPLPADVWVVAGRHAGVGASK